MNSVHGNRKVVQCRIWCRDGGSVILSVFGGFDNLKDICAEGFMKKLIMMVLGASMMVSCASASNQGGTESAAAVSQSESKAVLAAAPDNRPGADVDELWGEKVPDPYRWLENATDPEVKAWAGAQDKRARDYLNQLPMRDWFFKRIEELVRVPQIGVPTARPGMVFYSKRGVSDEKSIYYMRDLSKPDAPERVLLDPNKLSEDGSISVSGVQYSRDGRLMAYKLKKNNADQATLYFMDVASGENIPDKIEAARYASVNWVPDGSGFYYERFPIEESIPVDERPGMTDVRFHKFGTDESEDEVIIGPTRDSTKFQGAWVSYDGRWMQHEISDGWNGNTLRIRRMDGKRPDWVELPTKEKRTYSANILNDILYMQTNDGADRYRIVKIDLSGDKIDLSESRWQTIIPEFEDRVIEEFSIVQDKLFVVTLKDVVNYLDVYDLNGKHLKSIEMPDKGAILGVGGLPDAELFYFGFTSYRIPFNIYKLDVKTLEVTEWNKVEVPIKVDDFVSEQLFATSKDGTKVPMFVLRHKDTKLDGTAKTIIYGYGGFNVSITPSFSSGVFPWLEQGGIYVYSILRGGGEYGESWHQAGMGANKQNVFDDYYAVAEYLIANNYTRPESLAVYGGSNGGLLTGAALTQRPDLYGAVVCAVPLLDMIRYHLFGSGRTWVSEYGNAENSEAEFRTIRAYSPYANVKQTAYPAVLFLGADSDDRVDPMHARKMTAAIQDSTTSGKPVLLRIEKNAGHGGAGLVKQNIEKTSDIYSFLMTVLK